jgi:hypothetical protein
MLMTNAFKKLTISLIQHTADKRTAEPLRLQVLTGGVTEDLSLLECDAVFLGVWSVASWSA